MFPLMLFAGFFANTGTYLGWLDWVTYISPMRYTFEGLVSNQYEGVEEGPNPLEFLGFNLGFWNCIIYNLLLSLGFRIMSMIFLKLLVSRYQ